MGGALSTNVWIWLAGTIADAAELATLKPDRIVLALGAGEEINKIAVCYLRKLWGIRANRAYEGRRNPQRWDDGTYSIQGVMAAVGVPKSAVYCWLRQGLLDAKQSAKGRPWKVALSEEQILRLREYAQQHRPAMQRVEQAAP
jgi:hypothetical protein